MSTAAVRELLREAFAGALGALDLSRAVARAMPRVPPGRRSATLIAVGKAAGDMASGALGAAGAHVGRVLVVCPEGSPLPSLDHRGLEVLESSHPDPDARSVTAARRALRVVRDSDFTVALVSGGASSLICMPRGVTLARYVRVVRALLLAGATVRDVNIVRRHLCAVKGGGLARATRARVVTLVASDVIGGEPFDVGSGPTLPDPTSRADARAVMRRFVPRLARPPMRETLKPTSRAATRLEARVVASPDDLARAVARELRARRVLARVIEASTASAAELAREYAWRARRLRPGQAVVRAAEPSLRVDAARPGRGGRSTHLAVLVARELPADVVFLAGASDGVDGSSGTAGAIVDSALARRASADATARALAAFDTGPLVLGAGMALDPGPTGTNLADVHVLARA
ncbi:MAG TPA: DUF4147 domain-containing protein [Polyangiaceae bacterium]|nr:DUF4147 domain-containing protein [Polyangiaceae bacterium]